MYWLTASSTSLDFSYNGLIHLSVIKMFVSRRQQIVQIFQTVLSYICR